MLAIMRLVSPAADHGILPVKEGFICGVEASFEEKQTLILSELATTFSDDKEFLRKINKLTFGLVSPGVR